MRAPDSDRGIRAQATRMGARLVPPELGPAGRTGLVLALFLVGLGLRLAGLSYWLPDHIVHPDTPKQLARVARFMNGELIPRDTYPTLHMYVVALALKALGLLDPAAYHVGPSLTQVAVTARLLNGLLGAGIVLAVHAAGRRLFGGGVAALAAALAALSGLQILHAHYEMGDVPQAFCVAVSFAAAVRGFVRGGAASFLTAGAMAGLAAAAKYYGALAFGAVAVAALARAGDPWRRRLGLVLAAGVATALVFVLTTPKLLVTPVEFARGLAELESGLFPVPGPPLWQRPWVGGRLMAGLGLDWFGPLVVAAAGLGVVVALRRRPGGPLLLVVPALVALVYMLARPNYLDDRNLVIVAPFVALMAAVPVGWLAARGRLGRVTAAAAAVALLVATALDGFHTAYLFWQDDTRIFANRWSASHLPPDASVVDADFYAPDVRPPGTTADVLLTNSQYFSRHLDWYSPQHSPAVVRGLAFLEARGKLLQRFALTPRGFIAPTLAFYDLDSAAVPYAFPPPEDVPRPLDTLVFADPRALPAPLGLLLERGQSRALSLVAPGPLPDLTLALAGAGRARVRHAGRSRTVTLTPERLHLLPLTPRRAFPFFRYVYPLTLTALDAHLYVRLLPTPCARAVALLHTDAPAGDALAALTACQPPAPAAPPRLLALAATHARLGHPAETREALAALDRAAPGLASALRALARTSAADADTPAWRERYRTLAGHPRWFWPRHTVTLAAATAPVRVGTLAPDGLAVHVPRGTQGFLKLWFPPYFLRGRYLVRFRLAAAPAPGAPLATLSLVRHFQDAVHDVPVSRPWAPAAPGLHTVTLSLTTALEPIKLEARVLAHGPAPLVVHDVTVLPDLHAPLAATFEALEPLLAAR